MSLHGARRSKKGNQPLKLALSLVPAALYAHSSSLFAFEKRHEQVEYASKTGFFRSLLEPHLRQVWVWNWISSVSVFIIYLILWGHRASSAPRKARPARLYPKQSKPLSKRRPAR